MHHIVGYCVGYHPPLHQVFVCGVRDLATIQFNPQFDDGGIFEYSGACAANHGLEDATEHCGRTIVICGYISRQITLNHLGNETVGGRAAPTLESYKEVATSLASTPMAMCW